MVVTVMIVAPSLTGVMTPLSETVATVLLLLLHATSLLVAFSGMTVAVSCGAVPSGTFSAVWSRLTPVTATAPVAPPSSKVTPRKPLNASFSKTTYLPVPTKSSVMSKESVCVPSSFVLSVRFGAS